MLHNITSNYTTNNFEHFVTPWHERVSCVVLFTFLCIFGVITNGLVIALTFIADLNKNVVNLFIANLALSDFLCVGVFALGQNFYILYRESMPSTGCAWLAVFNACAAIQEIVFPPFLAINRYISLYHNHQYNRVYTGGNMLGMAVSSWLYSAMVASQFAWTGHTGFDIRNEHCCLITENDLTWSIIYFSLIVGPLIFVFNPIVLFCNWKIYKKLKEHADSRERVLQRNAVRENREIMYLMIIDMIIPICSHSLYNLAKFFYLDRYSLTSRQAFTTIYLITAGIRGTVIIWTLRPYRNAFKQYVMRGKDNKVGSTNVNTNKHNSESKRTSRAGVYK